MVIETKDKITLFGIVATFAVALVNLIYVMLNSRKTTYVNTVTSSRLRWIDSLRDKVSAFIAISVQLSSTESSKRGTENGAALIRERDTLMHQIILHLNPHDLEDQSIRQYVEQVAGLASKGIYTAEFQQVVVALRDATQVYLKKEWTRVKNESKSGEQR